MARRTAHAMAVAVALAAVCCPFLAAADGDFLQQSQPDVCQWFQWVCKDFCNQACCHIETGVSNPQGFCSQADADNSGKDHQWCCQGSGPWTDPIFTDFQNRTFEFFGDSGSVYNVLTHAAAVVNMRLAPAGARHLRHQDGGGTFTDVLAFKFGDTQVLVEASESGSMAVTVDDEELDLDKVFSETAKDVKVSFTPHAPGVGERLELNSDLFTFVVTAVKSFEDGLTGYNRGHLDLSTVVKAPPGHMDGVLGASLYVKPEDRLRDPAVRKFHDSEADYLVSHLFEGMEIRHATTRRRHLIEGSVADRLSFPLRAVLQ